MRSRKTRVKVNRTSIGRRIKKIGLVMLIIIGLLLAASALSNFLFSSGSASAERLPDLDKARVAEAFHLRSTFGDSLWPGWAAAAIPVVLYNRDRAFLIGISNPEPGWRTVPQDVPLGSTWEPVPRDSVEGRAYYSQPLEPGTPSPQSFTVKIGDTWAASMTLRDWMAVKMGNQIRDGLPALIRHVVPYRLMAKMFVGLALKSDAYICGLGHESFHAYQGMVAPQRLASAENLFRRCQGRYPWNDPSFTQAWKTELNILGDALSATERSRLTALTREFIIARQERRVLLGLDTALVRLEQLREWEEGLGKYTELALWQRASADSSYIPVRGLTHDSDFDGFRNFGRQWDRELSTLRLQSSGEETRFYYAGMAEAFLLDRLLPGWRTRILNDGVCLEDLLSEAIASDVGTAR